MKGVITKTTGLWYVVQGEDGNTYNCRLRGKFRIQGIKNTNPAVVGDNISFLIESDGVGYITEIEKRKNYIDRKSTKLSKISHIIAANIDIAFLVITVSEPRTSLGFIDRFLVAAEGFRIPTCIVINKMDLYADEELELVEEYTNLYKSIGYEVIHTSVVEGRGMEELKLRMKGKVSLLSGHSGVGKSAIVNHIQPDLQVKIGEISKVHNKGKHTTTFAQMFPLEMGGYIIDTPGIKEFGLIQYSKEEVRDYFPEIRAFNNCCKFTNCLHQHEPACQVIKAVENGEIPISRYQNYLAILADDDMQIEDWKLR